jgi:hypothetical protein
MQSHILEDLNLHIHTCENLVSWKYCSLFTSLLPIWCRLVACQVHGFKPSWSCRNFWARKILSMPSFGGEVKPSVPCCSFAACKGSVHLPWKSHLYTKLNWPFPRPYFPPSLTEVCHVVGHEVPLEMTGVGGGELNQAVHNRPRWGRSASGLQSRGSAPTNNNNNLV